MAAQPHAPGSDHSQGGGTTVTGLLTVWKYGNKGVVINAEADPPLSNFQTLREPYGLSDIASWARSGLWFRSTVPLA